MTTLWCVGRTCSSGTGASEWVEAESGEEAKVRLEDQDSLLGWGDSPETRDYRTYYLAQDKSIELQDRLVGLFQELEEFLPRYSWDEQRILGLLELIRDFQHLIPSGVTCAGR